MCVSCAAGRAALQAVTSFDYADDFMWSETAYPFKRVGWQLWREAFRVVLYRLTCGRFGKPGPEALPAEALEK